MDSIQQEPTKRCPLCGESILAIAVKCKHCGSMLEGVSPRQALPDPAPVQMPKASPPEPWRPYSFQRTLGWFWLGSTPGFLAFGFVFAGVLIASQGDSVSDNLDRALKVAVVLGGGAALILGLFLAAFFSQVMRKAAKGAERRQAFIAAGILTAGLGFTFSWFTEQALRDGYYLKSTVSSWVVAAAAMFGGAVLGMLKGRGDASPDPDVAPTVEES